MLGQIRDQDYVRIREFMYEHCGIDLSDGKRVMIQARLEQHVKRLGYAEFGDYFDYVMQDPDGKEMSLFVDTLSTNVTYFLREAKHFEDMARRVLPKVMSSGSKVRGLRIWCAGCSSGEEPFTIAMVLASNMARADFENSLILATDLSTRVLATARQACYDPKRLEEVPAHVRQRWFEPVEDGRREMFRVKDVLRNRVRFRHLNLLKDWPMNGPFDIIFCRNVMIYFDQPTRQHLVSRYRQLLTPGGTLYVGHAESLNNIDEGFSTLGPAIYERVE